MKVFSGKGDFLLWKQKMRAILIQQRVAKALDDSYPEGFNEDQKKEMDELAYSSIILHLSDAVLRKVNYTKSTQELWSKLNQLYSVTSLPSKIYLLESFFGYKMDPAKDLDENLDVFNKLVLDLANSNEKFTDEHHAVILLNSLPDKYKDIKTALKYGRDIITSNEIVSSLRSKDLELKKEGKNMSGEGLFIRGRSKGKEIKNSKSNSRGKSRSKSRVKGRKCYYCQKEGHYVKDCYKKKKKDNKEKHYDEQFWVV